MPRSFEEVYAQKYAERLGHDRRFPTSPETSKTDGDREESESTEVQLLPKALNKFRGRHV